MKHLKMVTPYLMTEPLTSTRHYGRYRTVIPQRAIYSVGVWPLNIAAKYSRYKFMAVSLPKRLWYWRFGSETAGFGSETAT